MNPKKNRKVEEVPTPNLSGTFYTVAKESHLLYLAYEVTVKNGVVESVRCISRAPDSSSIAVGLASRELWTNLRTQEPINDEK
jgi:hypothetical protein